MASSVGSGCSELVTLVGRAFFAASPSLACLSPVSRKYLPFLLLAVVVRNEFL